MNRKTLLRWVGGTALAGSLLTGGIALEGAFAQTPTTTTTQTPSTQTLPDSQLAPPLHDWDFGGGRGQRGGKLDLVAATASVTGLTSAEVQTALQAGKTFAAIAQENGKTADDVVNAAIAQLKTTLDAAVAAGTLTQAQADAQLAQATTKASTLVNQAGMPGGPGRGGPGHGGRGGPGGGGVDIVAATADVTGLSVADVRTALEGGKTPAQVAQENGKTADDVVKAAVASAKTRLDAAVVAGTITQAQADAQLAQVTEKATTQVNQAGVADGGKGHGGRRGGLDLVGTTAEVTGLTVEAVRTELAAGKSLAQVAQENGKTVDDVLAALQTKGQTQLTQLLEQAKTQLETPGGR